MIDLPHLQVGSGVQRRDGRDGGTEVVAGIDIRTPGPVIAYRHRVDDIAHTGWHRIVHIHRKDDRPAAEVPRHRPYCQRTCRSGIRRWTVPIERALGLVKGRIGRHRVRQRHAGGRTRARIGEANGVADGVAGLGLKPMIDFSDLQVNIIGFCGILAGAVVAWVSDCVAITAYDLSVILDDFNSWKCSCNRCRDKRYTESCDSDYQEYSPKFERAQPGGFPHFDILLYSEFLQIFNFGS